MCERASECLHGLSDSLRANVN
ncbi:MAG: hypothetical protein GY801_39675 [bacterium]|nr:hypothetical protein [bacterium]